MALYKAKTCDVRNAERRKVQVFQIKCLRNLVGVLQISRVRNEEVHISAGIERELVSKVDKRILRLFVGNERMDE